MATDARSDLQGVYVPLRLTYGLLPVAAGLDKFTNVLTDWQAYLPSWVAQASPVGPATFMHVVGVIEVVAGLAILFGLVRFGGFVVSAWLVLIAATVATAGYFDIAARDVAMSVGAYALAQVAALRGDAWFPVSTAAEGRRAHAGAN